MNEIDQAVSLLLAGELVAIPTETVYGLGADAANPAAVAKIFAAKGRPADHPLIVHIPGVEHLDTWARDIPEAARQVANAFWPGPLTLILKRQPGVPDAVTGGQDTVGLRCPGHPLALRLLEQFARTGGSGGIAAPSANRFGRISPTMANHVAEELGDKVTLILDGGPCRVGIESTIIDFSRATPAILRPGAITADDIAPYLTQPPHQQSTSPSTPRASGTLEAHYAPRTPMRVLDTAKLIAAVQQTTSAGPRMTALVHTPTAADALRNHPHVAITQIGPRPATYAHDLYATLRTLDHLAVDLILVEAIPTTPDWQAIEDRLRRAVAGSGQT